MTLYGQTNTYGTKSLYIINMYGKRQYIKAKEIDALTLSLSQGFYVEDIDTGDVIRICNITELWFYIKNQSKGG